MQVRQAFGLSVVVLSSFWLSHAVAHEPPVNRPAPIVVVPDGRPLIQVALLLDTSNSMDGLIDQARTQLWTIVNELGKCRRDGQVPQLQVALYEYGNTNLHAGEGFIRQVLPLSDNLDLLSEKLFSLRTNGGDEYCGHVIQSATQELNWSSSPNVYKAIFIAGNEPFIQGSVDYRSAIASAMGRGIVVNTIHCGDTQSGIAGMWQDGANRGEGKFVVINQDRVCAAMPAPQDDRIMKLSIELNNTYVPYGPAAPTAAARQVSADEHAEQNAGTGAAVNRAVSKASSMYRNSEWDLVDATKEGKVSLKDVDRTQLPPELAKMEQEKLEKHVESQQKRRAAIQQEIAKLNVDREQFLAQQRKDSPADTLDSAVAETVKEQASKRGFDVSE